MSKPLNKLSTLIFLFAIVLGVAILFNKYLSLAYVFIFEDIGIDTLILFYPNLIDDIRTIREGVIPFWSFSKGIGQGNFSEDFLNPFTWIYLILGTKYLAFGIGLVQFLKVITISLLSYTLFNIQKFDERAAIIGSILVTFSGYVIVGSSWYGHSSNIMYMLLFLVGLELWISRRQWWLMPISILFLLGPPLFFLAEFLLIYIVIRLSFAKNLKGKQVLNFVIQSWKPILVSILIVAPFLSAVVYKFIYSPRVSGSASYASDLSSNPIFASANSELYSTILYRFFSNDLLGTGDSYSGWGNYLEAPLFYCGLISILILPQIFTFLNRSQKIVFTTILIAWTTILIFPYFRYAFYLFMGNYFKGALSFFIPFTLIIMAVLTLDRLFKGGKINLWLLYGTGIILGSIILFPGVFFNNVSINSNKQILVIVFLILQILGLTAFQLLKQKEIWLSAIVLISLVEGVVFSYPALNDRDAITSEKFQSEELYNDYTAEAINYVNSIDSGFYRIEKTYGSVLSGLNDSQVQNYFDTKSYRSHNHNNYINFLASFDMMDPSDEYSTRWLSGLSDIPEFHGFFQVKYMLAKLSDEANIIQANYNNLGELNGINIHQSKFPVPFGFPVENSITESEFKSLNTYYKRLNALYTCAIIPDDLIDQYPSLKRKDISQFYSAFGLEGYYKKYLNRGLNITSFSQNKIKGSISIDSPSMIVFSFPFDDGWRVFVNGEKRKLDLIDNGLTGLYLNEGSYEVVLKYRPPFFEYALVLFFLGLGCLLYFGVFRKPKERVPFFDFSSNEEGYLDR